MKDIKDVYAIEPGKTYWVTVGTDKCPVKSKLVKEIKERLKKEHPENSWIVASHNIKPAMVRQDEGV